MKAIILAYKVGYSLSPLTQVINQSFLKYKTTALIELQIEQLLKNEVEEIYIIVGYRKEMFNELVSKYNVKLITYDNYVMGSDIQALKLVKEHLANCYIVDGNSVIFRLNKAYETTIYAYEQACNGRLLKHIETLDHKLVKVVSINKGVACTYSGVCYLDEKDLQPFLRLLQEMKKGEVFDIIAMMNINTYKISQNMIFRVESMLDYRNSLQIYEKYWQK